MALSPKASAVLHCLIERAGRLVARDELLDRAWPDTAVSEASLKVCIGEIRRALGDAVAAERFTATVHRRGDRFVAALATAATSAAGTRERMLGELTGALEPLAETRTLVLALEDLHWSDPSTLDRPEAAEGHPLRRFKQRLLSQRRGSEPPLGLADAIGRAAAAAKGRRSMTGPRRRQRATALASRVLAESAMRAMNPRVSGWTTCRRAATALAVLLACAGSAVARSALEIEGVAFAPDLRVGGHHLVLHNAGLLRYRLVIKAYVAALYLDHDAAPGDALGDVAKRLEAEYFWAIAGRDFGPVTLEGMRRNVDAATLATLRPRLSQFAALFVDVRPGDRYALTYLPGIGTELSLNGRALGTVPGADFAAALFAIWLGPQPLDGDLKRALLAKR